MKRKGFTLIELLAVIVILAIIALIATPIVLNMINSARKSAAKSAAYGYIEAIEYNNGFAELSTDAGISGYTKITTGEVSTINTALGSHIKGKKPDSGSVTVGTDGKVTGAEFCINGYTVTYAAPEITNVDKGCSGSSTPSTPAVTWDTYYTPTQTDGASTLPVNSILWIQENSTSGDSEVCGVYSNGTVCLTYNPNGRASDFESVSKSTYNITTIQSLQATGLQGYALTKAEEMINSGVTNCQVDAGEVGCTYEDLYCSITNEGTVRCNDTNNGAACNYYTDDSYECGIYY